MSSLHPRPSQPAATWPGIELREIGVFLTLAEELHFDRASARRGVGVAPPVAGFQNPA
jgi:hypothetical protein